MKLHEAQIASRSQMYMDSSREAFERGKMRARGVLELPEYPGGGSTPCLTRCRCEWIYEEIYEGEELVGYNCTWTLDPGAEHCEGCLDYEAKWNPLFVSVLGEAAGPGRGWWGPAKGGTHGTGKADGSTGDVAGGIASEAREKEPAITEAITGAAGVHGGEMEGLESRLKTEESLTRKLDLQAKQNGTTPKAEAVNIHDAARYTVVFDEGDYTKGVTGVQANLAKSGYTEYDHQFKNYWSEGGTYKGANWVFHDKAGFRFEVQFHTKKSIATKTPSHKIYETARTLPKGPKKTSMVKEMQSLWSGVPAPSGWQSLPGVSY